MLLFVLLCFFGLAVSAENVLQIVKLSPEEQMEQISSFAKLKFRNDTMFIYDHSGQIVSQNALANVRVMLFSEGENSESGINEVQEDTFLKVFPNPATYQISVENYEPVQSLRVYSLNGQAIMTENMINGTTATIDVSPLAEGSYILLVNQTAVKFIKK